MSDAYPGEDDRLRLAEIECRHEDGCDLVCRACGRPAAAPLEGFQPDPETAFD